MANQSGAISPIRPLRPACLGLVALTAAALLAACAGTATPEARPVATAPVAAAPSPAVPVGISEDKFLASIVEDDNVFFSLGSSTLQRAEKEKLRRHAERLKAEPDLAITLVGHADHTGSRAYNLAIADMRVAAVGQFLRSQGIPAHRIRRNMTGRQSNPENCATTACQQKMRRVELIYKD